MANVILTKTLTKDSQSFELSVKYEVETNTVTEIKSVWLKTHGKVWPVEDLMMAFFEDAINKIIDETDWREVYRDTAEYYGIKMSNIDKNIQQVLAPFIITN